MSNKALIAAALGLLWPLTQAHADGPNRFRTAFTGQGKCLDIINDGQGKCLDIINDGQNNTPTMADCGNYTGQMWSISPY